MNDTAGEWVPLMDYAIRKNVSLSTLRRHIKANKIPHRVENGRYLLLVEKEGAIPVLNMREDSATLHSAVHKLEGDLQRAQEEIAELKTLIALYEENLPPQRLNN
ncbi:MAG: hypothetical protein ACXWOH_09880 [Bdellovibrionota bacterium]